MREPDDAIAATRATFVRALAGGDAVLASSVFAEDARLLAPASELVRGRYAIRAFWRAGVDAGIVHAELEPVELERTEKLAYEIGRYALRLQPPGGHAVVDCGNYLLVHARQADGGWLWAVEMFNPDSR